ncbi:MAG: hypothetical protein EAX86_06195 [Candidatus Heimdallarchaeota archaeon]|nr:hypothetical protein [Candidatus Heimdallarchaeota archaeon]
MRKFAFQELAYAIVVATSYGALMGMLFNAYSDVIFFLLWVLLICAHLAGIYLIAYLEEKNEKKRNPND